MSSGFAYYSTFVLRRPIPSGRSISLLCPHFSQTIFGGTGISTCCPSASPFGFTLGPDLPRADEPSSGNLSHSVDRILTYLSLLTPAFSLLTSPLALQLGFYDVRTLSYHITLVISAASVVCLAPVHFRRDVTRPVSYYALFKWWLLLSQHPGCLCIITSFST